jgi:hypothetical protein
MNETKVKNKQKINMQTPKACKGGSSMKDETPLNGTSTIAEYGNCAVARNGEALAKRKGRFRLELFGTISEIEMF